jgi:hypothetical protein
MSKPKVRDVVALAQPDGEPPPHKHSLENEAYYVLRGFTPALGTTVGGWSAILPLLGLSRMARQRPATRKLGFPQSSVTPFHTSEWTIASGIGGRDCDGITAVAAYWRRKDRRNLLCVRWYLRYTLSYRDLTEIRVAPCGRDNKLKTCAALDPSRNTARCRLPESRGAALATGLSVWGFTDPPVRLPASGSRSQPDASSAIR